MTETKKSLLDEYLAKTGQSFQELMAGASQVGPSVINDELIPKALAENKKLVWKDIDLETGQGEYLFQELS